MKSILFAAIVLLLACTAHAIEQEEGVYVLTKDNFDDFVNQDGTTLVEFYAPWCGHCKTLAPEYAKAAQALKSHDPSVKLGKVDATVESELGSKFGVSGYPTLKVFNSGNPTDYKGPRDASGITAYMKKQASPSITDIKTLEDLEKFIADEAAVVYFGEAGKELSKAFEASAGKLRDSFRFARVSAGDLLEKAGHKNEVVLMQAKRYAQSPLESIKAVFKEGEGELSKFIHDNVLPLVGEVHEDNLKIYHGNNKPLMKVYSDVDWQLNPKGANYVLNRIRKIAKEYKDKVSFALANKKKHEREIQDSGLSGDLSYAIHDLGKGHKYPGSAGFSPETFKQHIEDFLASKLEPYIKSEAVPEQVRGEPTVVVGKNFNDIVNDPTKDVLLEAYAPWCGHCKQLDPKYKELAAKMAPYDSVTIAKVDATANDLPPQFQVKGYPTIFFVPANNKDKPVNYDGAREVKDFVSYIKKNAHLPLKKKDAAAASASAGKDEL